MLHSMTGYGRGEDVDAGVRVEIRSVNHRNLDVRVTGPAAVAALEQDILREVKAQVARGRLEIRVELDRRRGGGAVLNVAAAEHVYHALCDLLVQLGVRDEVSLSDVLRAPGMWLEEAPQDTNAIKPAVLNALGAALTALGVSREREGEVLRLDLLARLDVLERLLEQAKERAPLRVEEYQARLHERLESLLANEEVDAQRLAYEVALFADKADVAEEVTRAAAHIEELRRQLDEERSAADRAGKRIDFFLQELGREVNTMASKSRDADLTRLSIDMKTELESMREQAANVQ